MTRRRQAWRVGVLVAALCAAILVAPPVGAQTTTFQGSLDASGPNWALHQIEFASPGTVTATLDWDNGDADLNLGLRNPAGQWVKWSSSPVLRPERISQRVTEGTWAFGVPAKRGAASYTLTIDFAPDQEPATVRGRAWYDSDADGIEAVQEPGVSSVAVFARDGVGGVIAQTVTAGDGSYEFTDLQPGSYTIFFGDVAGHDLTAARQGGDPSVDSDPDPGSRLTPVFTLAPGEILGDIDAGYVRRPDDGSGDDFTFTGTLDAAGRRWQQHDQVVDQATTMTITLDWVNPDGDLSLFIRDPQGRWVATAKTSSKPEAIQLFASVTGTWTIGVRAESGATDYTLSVHLAATGSNRGEPVIQQPVHVRTIGGSERAELYPSGLDVAGQVVYAADTGGDGVAAYALTGERLWWVGGRGRQPGQFSEPRDVAYLDGKVYVADTGTNRVQVLDAATGAVLEVWPAFYKAAMGISAGVDAAGAPILLVTDGDRHRVAVHLPDGTFVRYIGGSFGSGDGQLNEPRDAVTTPDGTIYIADFRNHRIAVFDAGGGFLRTFLQLGDGPGDLNGPYGIDIDADSTLYVADTNHGAVKAFDTAGTLLGTYGAEGAGAGEFLQLRRGAVADGPTPDVFGADLWQFKIERFAADGTHQQTYAGAGPALGGFNKPYGLAVARDHVFVADTTNQRVQRFDHEGTFQTWWGGRGFVGDPNGMNWPRQVAVDEDGGTVWLADTKNFRILEYTFDGTATGRVFGMRGDAIGELDWVIGITTTDDGDLIVADTYNHRVQRWDPDTATVLWTATGFNFPKDVQIDGEVVYVVDSLNHRIVTLQAVTGVETGSFGPPHLHRPEGLAVDPWGNLWVADTGWNRLVHLAPDGTMLQRSGRLGSDVGRFIEPTRLVIHETDSDVLLYVVDTGNDRVQVFDVD